MEIVGVCNMYSTPDFPHFKIRFVSLRVMFEMIEEAIFTFLVGLFY